MAKQKPLGLVSGETQELLPAVVSAGSADAGKLAALGPDGRWDLSTMPRGIGPNVEYVVASEALAAGSYVNYWNDTSVSPNVLKARLADNSNARKADGFVFKAFALGETAEIYDDVGNPAVSGKTPGAIQYLGTAGGTIEVPLDNLLASNAGKIHQTLGKALSATLIDTRLGGTILITG